MPSSATYRDLARISLIRFIADAATRGRASGRVMSVRVAALTCARVFVRDPFVFRMVPLVTKKLLESVLSGTPVPRFMRAVTFC